MPNSDGIGTAELFARAGLPSNHHEAPTQQPAASTLPTFPATAKSEEVQSGASNDIDDSHNEDEKQPG